jgi:cob(I)alamin adenosyltransferase
MLMVRIDRVVTRGGDTGETSLGNGERVRKDGQRIAAIGTVDEANAAVGVLRLETRGLPDIDRMLARIQNDLFDVGADLCVPGEGGDRLRVGDSAVKRLEAEIEAMNASLPRLTSFVLPGGSAGAAHAHMARAIIRRAERDTVRLVTDEAVNPVVVRYLNRLSDHLFVLARMLNGKGTEEVLWIPGGAPVTPV